ncbi:hypothetical protein GCM10023321_26250 [Pseudonocardia eucalypti]|uniref:Uncharacterized protein n=1 Tax=Pseudonocardia eucalypti TaxID=648755 RepID=A0ABP9PYN6_9PSEU|nr:hypothetical protein [Pseudonocardia eucalypti]
MPKFKILRIYEVPGKDQTEASDRMMAALELGVERDYHMSDYIKPADDKLAKSQRVSLKPPKGWGALILDQLLGR